jgi:Zn finger protein HypA/HybF involved in hydrogenase expression
LENETDDVFYAECDDCGHVADELPDDFEGICPACGSENLTFERI